VAILANVLRIVLMAVGAKWFGEGWISGPLHTAPAFFSIPVGLGLYALVGWGLGQFWPVAAAEERP
jgi:exosortase/archaeosortase family protein